MRKVTLEVDDSVAAALCLFLRYILDKGAEDMVHSEVGPHMRTVMMTDPGIGDKLYELHEKLKEETKQFAVDHMLGTRSN